VKVRQAFPAGHTSAARIKAMLACIEAEKGRAAADGWLEKSRLARTDLDDETRLLPLAALRTAASAFIELLPHGFDALPSHFTTRDNLGVWARVLRGTRAPEEALARIETTEGEHGTTTRWETLEAGARLWRGRMRIEHDPELERDGLLRRVREAELAVVPTLFGYVRGRVTRTDGGDDTHTYEVRWTIPTPLRSVAGGAAAGVLAGVGAALVHPSLSTSFAAVLAPLLAGGLGLAWSRDRTRKIESSAQAMRVSALERSLSLRDAESRALAGDLEGAIVAGQYRIGVRMGSGASGVIYQAVRIADGLPVAIKLLRAATAHDASASDRLRRESEALGLSWHPNVVEVIDHGHLPDGTSYLVMELLKGETLATRLKQRTRFSAAELLPIAKQVVDALVAIHAAGVVHRDLKPANIYLVPEADRELVKVFDFGIARVEWEEMRITNMGAALGTPGYMSPEQESGGEIDARSDVYAAGAVLYECLVGEPPPLSPGDMWKPGSRRLSSFSMRFAETRTDSGVQPASRRMPSAAPVASTPPPVDAPPEWRTIVERALAKRADDRFPNARALLDALRELDASARRATR
jgi:serine/threonine protein kinase